MPQFLFEKLRIFQLAREIAKFTWEVTKRKAVREDFGIVRQMRNSSGSMMDNVAEGHGRGSNNEFKTFLAYAKSSCNELQSQYIRLLDRDGCITQKEFDRISEMNLSFCKQTTSFMTNLKNSGYKGHRLK